MTEAQTTTQSPSHSNPGAADESTSPTSRTTETDKQKDSTPETSETNSVSEVEFAITLDNVSRLQRAIEKQEELPKEERLSYEKIFEMAVRRSKVQICKYCLKQDSSIDVNKSFPSFSKSNALMQSIKTKTTTDKELYKLLLQHGADPRKGDDYFTPIQKAITNQDEDLIDTLVDAGVSLEEEDTNQAQRGTPLWFALHMNCFSSFSHLIKLGANVNAKRKGKSLLHYVSEHREIKQGPQVVKLLLDNHADVEATDERGMTPFLHAADYGRLEIMQVLKEAGANVQATDKNNKNALAICVDSAHAVHHLDAVEYVLSLDLDDTEAVKALQNMVQKIGGELYKKMADVFIKHGKKIDVEAKPQPKAPSADEKQDSSTTNDETEEAKSAPEEQKGEEE